MVMKISILRVYSPLLPFSDCTYENTIDKNAYAFTFAKFQTDRAKM